MDKKEIAQKTRQTGNLIANKIVNELIEAKKNNDNSFYNEGYEHGCEFQKERDLKAVVLAFLELKVSTEKIYILLNNYFGIESIPDAARIIISAKISHQIIALRQYCSQDGMSDTQFREYAKQHKLEARLSSDEKLLELKPEKLKSLLDKE